MKLALVISSLGPGGAERVLVNMANFWARRGEDVTLITLSRPTEEKFHALDGRIKHTALGVARSSKGAFDAISGNVERIRAVRGALRATKPDLAISFIDATNVTTLFASRGLGFPVIVSDRVDPTNPSIGRVWEQLRKISYPWATSVVIQTSRFAPFYSAKIQKRIRVIQNPISELVRSALSGPQPERTPVVLGVGRLSDQKTFDVLIAAFDKIAPNHPTWQLEIYGDGPLKQKLQDRIDLSTSRERMHLRGITKKPIEKMRSASVFALSSQSEGIPNVLLEAMSAGCPAVATDVGAVGDILVDGENGFIVPAGDVEKFAQALDKLMSSPDLRASIGARATAILDRLSEEKIMAEWDRAISDHLAKP